MKMKTGNGSPPLAVLTGAGISAESGLRTFRDAGGLWENHRVEDVATPAAFHRNPDLVHRFYNERRRQLSKVAPNAAHLALGELERRWQGDFLLITQNVDDLHERGGSNRLLHMHGELIKSLCRQCGRRREWRVDMDRTSVCMDCQAGGALRPDIVWFGEMPYHMDEITEFLESCELLISIGTSGRVYPAAGFARGARRARRIEVNLEPSDISDDFHEHRIGSAATEVPKLVQELLG